VPTLCLGEELVAVAARAARLGARVELAPVTDDGLAGVSAADALVLDSGPLAAEPGRAIAMQARDMALEAEIPVVLAVRLRLARWRSRADAMATIDACVPGALLVCAESAEAELLTGERDPERAAVALRKAGARLVLIARGADGAILRGEQQATASGPAAGIDALAGVVLGRLALAGYYPSAAATALAEAARG
jgi:fructokinase